ncbi:hypothetical protein CTA2_6681 [Colletotrichum tanaceti]|uniref:Rhodopsin domain-containing protein n=1 Tax=Colletotrichum tanaceti TaxID=1306861 RepID=A0A4U6XNW6_9PEZI|nr:hypothetical protein CTA2_6681 [Colletotrichum tanaceti]TKW57475.1 hypothetical protein CTA1_8548 [Colletotrichum tanaceti]
MAIGRTEFLTAEWVLLFLCFVVVLARLAVRTWHKIWSFWLSEVFLVLALLFFLALVVGDTYTMSIGKNAFVDEYFDEAFAKWKFASSVIFDLGFYFPRFSLLAFYYELFPAAEKRLRLYLHLVTAYCACALATTAFVGIFWCGPDVSLNWVNSESVCTLASRPEPMYINWSIGITSELLVFALPFGILRLKALKTKDRRALLCIFLLGVSTLITSTVRFYLTVQSIWSFSTYLVGSAEIASQIIVIALPALRPLLGVLARWRSKCFQSRIRSQDKREARQVPGTAGSLQSRKRVEACIDTVDTTRGATSP